MKSEEIISLVAIAISILSLLVSCVAFYNDDRGFALDIVSIENETRRNHIITSLKDSRKFFGKIPFFGTNNILYWIHKLDSTQNSPYSCC